jgi:hypothetical protein
MCSFDSEVSQKPMKGEGDAGGVVDKTPVKTVSDDNAQTPSAASTPYLSPQHQHQQAPIGSISNTAVSTVGFLYFADTFLLNGTFS